MHSTPPSTQLDMSSPFLQKLACVRASESKSQMEALTRKEDSLCSDIAVCGNPKKTVHIFRLVLQTKGGKL